LQNKIQKLDEMVNKDGGYNKQTGKHSATIVNSLNSILLDTTKQFRDTLNIRTQNLKEQEERRERVTGHRTLSTQFKFQTGFDNFDEDGMVSHNNGDVVIGMAPMIQSYDESLVLQRVDQVREIESQIKNIQEIFIKLAELVAQHSEKIRRIEDRVEEVLEHGESAHNSLMEVYNNLSGNRRLILKSFGVVMFFIIVWILFFA